MICSISHERKPRALSTTEKLNRDDLALLRRMSALGITTQRRDVGAHRAPRVWLKRHTRAATALLVATAGLLGASGVVTSSQPRRGAPLTVAAAVPSASSALESLADAPTIVADPAPERRAESGRASRATRAERRPAPTRWVRPLARMIVTSCFGPRHGGRHGGLDLDGETGDAVRSVGAGTVVQVGYRYGASGLTVVVDHGEVLTMYAHLSRAVVGVGQRLVPGQRLGAVGTTGRVTGSHLHLAVSRTGTLARLWDHLVDPAPWLRARGVAVPGC